MDYLSLLKDCRICPHECGIDRTAVKNGWCGAGLNTQISAAMPHFGEEPPISGTNGSGTIFFLKCNMHCVYCQNYQISQDTDNSGSMIENNLDLTDIMLDLQNLKCHNINLVSPTIWSPQIADAVEKAKKKGLKIPIIYNCGGYEKKETIQILKDTIDIYMPDIRYGNDDLAYKYSKIKSYTKNSRESLIEMYEQAGELKTDKDGIAYKGLIIRLLILPNNIGQLKKSLDFIKNELSTDVYISIMSQYRPVFKASKYMEINRNIYYEEYKRILEYAQKLGFEKGSIQEYEKIKTDEDLFMPDFNKEKIFKYEKE